MSPDPVQEWTAARERVTDLVLAASPRERERRVPACPDWTVLDLLRHVVGLAADVLEGDEPDDHHASWTQAQVESRRHLDAEAVLQEWVGDADALTAWMREHGSRPLNDVVVHEHDLRGALGVPGARGSGGLAVVRGRLLGRLDAAVEGLAPLALVGESFTHVTAGAAGPDEAAVVLEADDFDLARAVMSRRTAAQLAAYVVRGDVTPYLDAFGVLGPLPREVLPE